MQTKMTYQQQLNHPLWKQKRDAILARDNFTCLCGVTEPLHVHHMKYTGYAWEAPDNDLITLCNDCHRKIHTGELKLVIERPKEVFDSILMGESVLVVKAALSRIVKEACKAVATLYIFITNVEQGNLVRLRSITIAHKLGVTLTTVDRHIKKLRSLGIIEPDSAEGDKQRGVFNWRICPFLGWSGGTDKLHAYLKTLPPEHPWLDYNVTE